MDDLVRWLGEQLDEDERIAREALRYVDADWHRDGEENVTLATGMTAARQQTVAITADRWRRPMVLSPAVTAHVAEWDPARVLREVGANRRRLARHTPQMMVGYDSDENDPSTYVLGCPVCQTTVVHEGDWPCAEVRDIVASFVDRPGYRDQGEQEGEN